MKHILILFLLILNSFIAFTQEEEMQNDKKGKWRVDNYFGVATLENKDNYKVNATVYGGKIEKEIILNNLFYFVTGIEFLVLRTDLSYTNGQQLYLKNNYLKLWKINSSALISRKKMLDDNKKPVCKSYKALMPNVYEMLAENLPQISNYFKRRCERKSCNSKRGTENQ